MATTATATLRVQKDIEQQMGGQLTVIRGNLLRDNFCLYVINVITKEEKMAWLGEHINQLEGTGILYTGTRPSTDIYSRWLDFLKVSSVGYNAGLDADSRITIENGLMNNTWKCIISTNALGMGIDKPDIRFIIHTQIPQSPVHYYQEIGRAGRDGKPTMIILFYGPKDRELPESFIEGGRPSLKKYEKVIQTVKNELLGEREIIKRANIKQDQFRVIKADLTEQGITRITSEQKVFENTYLKRDNVKDAFTLKDPNEITGKSILLIDDICDSGATLKELGTVLSNFGASKIAPLVIAKTVGGDLA